MTDWAPKISIMSEERDLLLQLVRRCKKQEAENMATTAALGLHPDCQTKIADTRNNQMPIAERHIDVRFRRLETALIDGSEYLTALKNLLR